MFWWTVAGLLFVHVAFFLVGFKCVEHWRAFYYVYVTFDAAKPGTEVNTGTSYGSIQSGKGAQSTVYFVRYDGAAGTAATPKLIDNQRASNQFFSAISADGGILHAL